MKSNKLFSVLGVSLAVFLTNCEDPSADNVNDNCAEITQFFENDDDPAATFLDQQVVIQCATSQEGLDVIIASIEAENERLNELFNPEPVDPDPVDPDPMPMEDATITFDDPAFDVLGNSFSFGDIASINVIPNPVPGGTNPEVSSVFEAVVDTGLGNGFNGIGISIEDAGIEVLDFTGNDKQITVSVFSEVAFTLQAQIGNGRDENDIDIIMPRPANTSVAHTGSGWEDLVFDFSTGPLFNPFSNNPEAPAGGSAIPEEELGDITGTYNAIQFQFNNAPADAMTTFYIDNLDYISTPVTIVVEPIEPSDMVTFDEAEADVLANSFSFGDIASINVVLNPVPGGTNPDASNVFEAVVDTALGNGFNGFGFDVEASGLELLDFTGDNKLITVSVYSEVAFDLQLQIGNGRDDAGVDIIDPRPANTTAAHTGSGWEDLVFDFSTGPLFNPFSNNPDAPGGGSEIPEAELGDITGTYNAIQFQFNGAPADAMTTFYIDNVTYN